MKPSPVPNSMRRLPDATTRPVAPRPPSGYARNIAADTCMATQTAAPPPYERPALTVKLPAPTLAPDRVRSLLVWMERAGLLSSDGATGLPSASPWLRLQLSSAEGVQRRQALRQAHPKLTAAEVDCIISTMVRRAHAEHADPAATTTPLHGVLHLALDLLASQKNYSQVVRPAVARQLLFLSAPHYDGCLFDPNFAMGGGGQGTFYVGLTRSGHPVAVKGAQRGALREGTVGVRSSQAVLGEEGLLDTFGQEAGLLRAHSGYDVLHLVQTPEHRYIVMPLFSGNLAEHAACFANLRPPTEDKKSASPTEGLFGVRYLLRQTLEPLHELHERSRLVHQDIKAVNIFVDRARRRLLLGDLGATAKLGPDNRAPWRGHTERYAAPEQIERSAWITTATDIYGVGATFYEMLVLCCTAVMERRKELAKGPVTTALLIGEQLPSELTRDARSLFYRGLADELPRLGANAPAPDRHLEMLAHLRNVNDAIALVDEPLSQLLQSMVRTEPERRPSAAWVLQQLDTLEPMPAWVAPALDAAWTHGVRPYAPAIDAQLRRLGGVMVTINGGGQAPPPTTR